MLFSCFPTTRLLFKEAFSFAEDLGASTAGALLVGGTESASGILEDLESPPDSVLPEAPGLDGTFGVVGVTDFGSTDLGVTGFGATGSSGFGTTGSAGFGLGVTGSTDLGVTGFGATGSAGFGLGVTGSTDLGVTGFGATGSAGFGLGVTGFGFGSTGFESTGFSSAALTVNFAEVFSVATFPA